MQWYHYQFPEEKSEVYAALLNRCRKNTLFLKDKVFSFLHLGHRHETSRISNLLESQYKRLFPNLLFWELYEEELVWMVYLTFRKEWSVGDHVGSCCICKLVSIQSSLLSFLKSWMVILWLNLLGPSLSILRSNLNPL